jgi:isopenicillin-N N-acyltransferase-like protein
VHGRTFVLRARRKDAPELRLPDRGRDCRRQDGVNECGIGLTENGLASSHDGRNPYCKPFHVRCREEVLDAESFEDATLPATDTAEHLLGQFRDRRSRRQDRRH